MVCARSLPPHRVSYMKALPWIAVIVLAAIAAAMFRYQIIQVETPESFGATATLDRWTGRVELAPVPIATPTPEPAVVRLPPLIDAPKRSGRKLDTSIFD